MNLLFFQNCISPHQMPYIKEMPNINGVDHVIVISPEATLSERARMGWDIEAYLHDPAVRCCIAPTDQEVTSLLSTYAPQDTVCLFSGIRDFPDVHRWFKLSLSFPIRRAILKELPNTYALHCANGKPLWLHQLRFMFRERHLAKHVDCVFAIGTAAVTYFKRLYDWKVFPFGYCTATSEVEPPAIPANAPLRLCFVGSLEWWKDVRTVLFALSALPTDKRSLIEFRIVGEGSLLAELQAICRQKQLHNVLFLGQKPNNEIPNFMAENDLFILPSVYDGWGAVVNEALLSGLYTLCSRNAGASALINGTNGQTFKAKDTQGLSIMLQSLIDQRAEIRLGRANRIIHARQHISGRAVANYLYACLCQSRELPVQNQDSSHLNR